MCGGGGGGDATQLPSTHNLAASCRRPLVLPLLQVRAEEALFNDMVKLSFSTLDGNPNSTTLAAEHIVHLLTAVAPTPAGGSAAALTPKDCKYCV